MESHYRTWVQLDGRAVPYDEVRDDPDGSEWLLSRAWADKSARCLCQRPSPLPLVTRCRSGRYSLACWPRTGARHDPRCAFHRLDPELTGQTAYQLSAIRPTDDGGALIKFAGPLTSTLAEATDEPITRSTNPALGRSSIGPTGLLHYLWEESGLTTWHPGNHGRTWALVTAMLRDHIAGCTINGQPGSDVLYVVPPYTRGTDNTIAFDTWLGTLNSTPTHKRRGFVLGVLERTTQTTYGHRYQLAGQRARQVFVRTTLHERLLSSYRSAMSKAAADADGRRVLFAYVERSAKGYTVAVDASLMLTNHLWIPADSSHEVRAADALVKAKRAFVKPLIYDREDLVLPDFVLTDEDPYAVFEVWGRTDKDYLARKRDKQAFYAGKHLYEWNVDGPMPSLTHPRTAERDRRSSPHES
ncbi:DUF1173 family protein [Nocardia suismassiliense]|uniref:DUF1173 family protein n=1 Tax=Nocardia suismassiliense TaxID=2077092 RepID=UPI00131F3627|nr:DUF1173 family protein [Nocardia suismassiliense]